jgi:hypothetical protein
MLDGYCVAHQLESGLADEDLTWLSRLLESGRDVDGVADYERLTGEGIAHHNLARVNPSTRLDLDAPLAAEVDVERLQVDAHVERCANGTQGVIFVKRGDAEDSHDGVADELLYGPAVAFDDSFHGVEVEGHHSP